MLTALRPRRSVFSDAYEARRWGSDESGSGRGSEMDATATLRSALPDLLRRLDVRHMVDAPCGDWNWMRTVDLSDVDYVGVDIVPSVIARNIADYARPGVQFIVADLCRDPLPAADFVLCRDCWIHLSYRDIDAMLANFRKTGAVWLMTSHSPSVSENRDQLTHHHWRHVNMRLPPFNFPEPIEAIPNDYPDHPFVALWRIADLPALDL
jgi:SAM-dependent methyltransferase